MKTGSTKTKQSKLAINNIIAVRQNLHLMPPEGIVNLLI